MLEPVQLAVGVVAPLLSLVFLAFVGLVIAVHVVIVAVGILRLYTSLLLFWLFDYGYLCFFLQLVCRLLVIEDGHGSRELEPHNDTFVFQDFHLFVSLPLW